MLWRQIMQYLFNPHRVYWNCSLYCRWWYVHRIVNELSISLNFLYFFDFLGEWNVLVCNWVSCSLFVIYFNIIGWKFVRDVTANSSQVLIWRPYFENYCMHLSFPSIYATLILSSSYLGWWITLESNTNYN